MTFALSAIRDDIEADLRDSTNLTWSTAQIDRGIAQALDRYAHAAPREVTATLTGISTRTIDLSAAAPGGLGSTAYAALDKVEAVEYPVGNYPPTYCRFDFFGASLVMHVDSEPADADVKLYYLAGHELAATGTVPDRDRELLAVGGAAYCLRQRAAGVAETLNTVPNATKTLRELADDRMRVFEEGLDRLRRRVKQRTRYAPEPPYLNRDIVQFP